MNIETITYKLPAYWASYLINGDASGLESVCPAQSRGQEKGDEQSEQATIDAWLESEGNPHFVDCGEQYFSHSNDATTLGGDVCDYVAHIIRKAAKN